MELNTHILRAIECPACLEYMHERIYVCISGHSICQKCWKALQKCPTCRRELSETRNYTLESLTELLYYPCHNSEFGCKENLKQTEYEDHATVCSYRKYKCKLQNNCQWKGRRYEIERHCLDVHKENVLLGSKHVCWWKSNMPKYEITLIIGNGEIFYLHRKIKDNTMFWVLQYIGKSEDVIQFCYEITIFSDQFQNRKLVLAETCQDDLKDDINEIIDSGFAVGTPLAILDTYKNEHDCTWYKIEIKKT